MRSGAATCRSARRCEGAHVLQTTIDPSFGGNGPPQPDQLVDRASGLTCVMPAFSSPIPPVYTYFQGDGATHAREPSGSAMPAPATMYYESTLGPDDLGSCSATPGQAYVPLGPELPASRFVELTLEVD